MSRGFFRSTAIVGMTTLLSRITGLVRDVVYATVIPSVFMEVFVLANQIPNLLRRLFAEGAFSQAFVPVVAEYKTKRSKEDVRELVDSSLGEVMDIVNDAQKLTIDAQIADTGVVAGTRFELQSNKSLFARGQTTARAAAPRGTPPRPMRAPFVRRRRGFPHPRMPLPRSRRDSSRTSMRCRRHRRAPRPPRPDPPAILHCSFSLSSGLLDLRGLAPGA